MCGKHYRTQSTSNTRVSFSNLLLLCVTYFYNTLKLYIIIVVSVKAISIAITKPQRDNERKRILCSIVPPVKTSIAQRLFHLEQPILEIHHFSGLIDRATTILRARNTATTYDVMTFLSVRDHLRPLRALPELQQGSSTRLLRIFYLIYRAARRALARGERERNR